MRIHFADDVHGSANDVFSVNSNLATKRQCAKCSRAEELGTSNFSDCQPRQLISYFERKATILMHRLSISGKKQVWLNGTSSSRSSPWSAP
ncbi:unnamed protein product [Caenorhabditis nigoni]